MTVDGIVVKTFSALTQRRRLWRELTEEHPKYPIGTHVRLRSFQEVVDIRTVRGSLLFAVLQEKLYVMGYEHGRMDAAIYSNAQGLFFADVSQGDKSTQLLLGRKSDVDEYLGKLERLG